MNHLPNKIMEYKSNKKVPHESSHAVLFYQNGFVGYGPLTVG